MPELPEIPKERPLADETGEFAEVALSASVESPETAHVSENLIFRYVVTDYLEIRAGLHLLPHSDGL
jgi:hypothetical protein